MDVLGNGPSEELLMQWRVYRISVKQEQKQKQKTKLYLLTKGPPFLGGRGAQGAIAPRHPGPVRHWINVYVANRNGFISSYYHLFFLKFFFICGVYGLLKSR